MFRSTRKIGRPSQVSRKGQGLYKVTYNNPSNLTGGINRFSLFSGIAFGDPVIQVSSGASYAFMFKPNLKFRCQYAGPTDTEQILELFPNGSATPSLYNVSKSHTSGLSCADPNLPELIINGQKLIKIDSSITDERCDLELTRAFSSGVTFCSSLNEFEIIFELLSGSIVDINRAKDPNGDGTVFKIEEL